MHEQFEILERESHVPEVLEKLLLDCLLESFAKLDVSKCFFAASFVLINN